MRWLVWWEEPSTGCAIFWGWIFVCQIVGGVTVFVTRILAVKYRICLPILSGNEEEQEG